MACNLNRPTTIPGYIEPEQPKASHGNNRNMSSVNRSSYGIYKTFDENAKGKKKGEFKTTELVNKYGNNNFEEDNEIDNCPVCSDPHIYVCPCVYNDKKCKNEHIWYIKRDGKVVVGNPHKK